MKSLRGDSAGRQSRNKARCHSEEHSDEESRIALFAGPVRRARFLAPLGMTHPKSPLKNKILRPCNAGRPAQLSPGTSFARGTAKSHRVKKQLCATFLILIFTAPAGAYARKKKKDQPVTFQQSLYEYIRQAQQGVANAGQTPGSIWNPNGVFSRLPRDDKAYRLGDILTINIIEQTTAQTTGNVKTSRTFSANSGISALFGQIGPTAGLQNIFSPNSARALNGQAQTQSSSLLTTAVAASVVAVLPNDYMVVQATRTVEVDNELQQVILRGIARPSDISPDNSIPSTSLADLSVQVVGKGVITDDTRPPNKVIRAILRVVGF